MFDQIVKVIVIAAVALGIILFLIPEINWHPGVLQFITGLLAILAIFKVLTPNSRL